MSAGEIRTLPPPSVAPPLGPDALLQFAAARASLDAWVLMTQEAAPALGRAHAELRLALEGLLGAINGQPELAGVRQELAALVVAMKAMEA